MTSTLPAAAWENPTCGACYSETNSADYGYVCEPCGLWFDRDDDIKASYLDEGAEPCGNPCDNTWHNSRDLGPYECNPCHLPKGHESTHHTPCKPLPKGQQP